MSESDIFDFTRKQIFWMIIGVVAIIVLLSLVFMLRSYQKELVEVPDELQAELIILRFVNNPDCFAYQDANNGRAFPGVIDVSKFTQERLDKCYATEKEKGFKDLNFGLDLEGYTPALDGKQKILMTNNYFNVVDFTVYKNVLVRSGDLMQPTRLVIYVQVTT
ncbi:MAG: hypothetical protein AABX05_03555 [Nanoarchaeota archaeon]